MEDSTFKKKYLKYKKKYILNKQKGGERHQAVIRKSDNEVNFINGFNLENLVTNGDYHIIHAYDEELRSSNIMKNKIDQLNLWLSTTFTFGNLPLEGNENINKSARIYNSNQKQELIDLVNWFLDPKDN